jgi:hypothetical protein
VEAVGGLPAEEEEEEALPAEEEALPEGEEALPAEGEPLLAGEC